MSQRTRRSVLALGAAVGGSLLAGCASPFGLNPTLRIESRFDEAVTLGVRIRRYENGAYETVVFDEQISVPAGETVSREVFERSQYEVAVTTPGSVMRVVTRPICDGARTVVRITPTGELTNRVRFCE